jgi:hypothetical protein
MLRSTFSRSRSSALPSGCFRNTQVAHTRSNSFTVCPLTASNGWNGPGVLPASNGKRLCHCLSTYLVFLSSEQCATSFFLTIFFVSDQTLHRVMNLGTQMLDWSDTSSTLVNHGGASCILLAHDFFQRKIFWFKTKDFQDTILVSIHNTVCTDLLAAL